MFLTNTISKEDYKTLQLHYFSVKILKIHLICVLCYYYNSKFER